MKPIADAKANVDAMVAKTRFISPTLDMTNAPMRRNWQIAVNI